MDKSRRVRLAAFVITIAVGGCATAGALPLPAANPSLTKPKWNVHLANTAGRIRLVVSTKNLKTNTYLTGVKCRVTFLNSSGVKIGSQTFNFTTHGETLLPKSQTFERIFAHSYASTSSVRGESMAYTIHILGGGVGWTTVHPQEETYEDSVDPDSDLP